ncbi:MAG: class I SAM-dependent methyltransferase, partial [Stellaceae bacterium]
MTDAPKTEAMNLYGDRLVPTTGLHGSNVSSQRIDELDTACLEFIERRVAEGQTSNVLDIGGGNGAQARRMAQFGANVTFVDLTDQNDAIDGFNAALGRTAIHFHQIDVRRVRLSTISPPLDVIYSQRMMGCIRYGELRRLLKSLCRHTNPGARCFISASGLDTEYGAT